MRCLYATDYGAPDPGFAPLPPPGARSAWQQAHAHELATAQNPAQLAAITRQLDRGEAVVWCRQGYGWTESVGVEVFIALAMAVALPALAVRLARRVAPRLGARARRGGGAAAAQRERGASL